MYVTYQNGAWAARAPFAFNDLMREIEFDFHKADCPKTCKACAASVPKRWWWTRVWGCANQLLQEDGVDFTDEARFLAQWKSNHEYVLALLKGWKNKRPPLPPVEPDVWCVPDQILVAAGLATYILVPMQIWTPDDLVYVKKVLQKFQSERNVSESGRAWIEAVTNKAERRLGEYDVNSTSEAGTSGTEETNGSTDVGPRPTSDPGPNPASAAQEVRVSPGSSGHE